MHFKIPYTQGQEMKGLGLKMITQVGQNKISIPTSPLVDIVTGGPCLDEHMHTRRGCV